MPVPFEVSLSGTAQEGLREILFVYWLMKAGLVHFRRDYNEDNQMVILDSEQLCIHYFRKYH